MGTVLISGINVFKNSDRFLEKTSITKPEDKIKEGRS